MIRRKIANTMSIFHINIKSVTDHAFLSIWSNKYNNFCPTDFRKGAGSLFLSQWYFLNL